VRRRRLDRDIAAVTDEERQLLAPHPPPATTSWVRPISAYGRRDTTEGESSRFG
jgi:hypothetical protein